MGMGERGKEGERDTEMGALRIKPFTERLFSMGRNVVAILVHVYVFG